MKPYHYLIVAEKNDQAKQIIAAMGFSRKGTHAIGEVGGKKAILCWSKGHLFGYKSPQEVTPGIDWKTLSTMTPVPRNPPRVISKDDGGGKSAPSTEYFERIKSFAKDCEEFVICTDPDEEGEKIGWEIYENLGIPSMPVRRIWLAGGLGVSAVRDAFSKILDGSVYKPYSAYSDARSASDYAYQYLTRALTAVGNGGAITAEFQKGTGKSSVASCGRVQTTTLAMIVARDAEVESFVKKVHHTIHGTFDSLGALVEARYAPELRKEYMTQFHKGVEWIENKRNGASNKDAIDKPIFVDLNEVNLFRQRLMASAAQAKVVSFDKKEGFVYPPMTFDTTDALKEISKVVKGSATDIQEILNFLYLNGYTTYPRTDHKEIPNEVYSEPKNRNGLLNALSKIPQISNQAIEAQSIHNGTHPDHKPFKPKCFADKSVEHNGIIPTADIPDLMSLTSQQREAYLVIAKRFIQALYPPKKNHNTTVTYSVPAVGMFQEPLSLFKVKSSYVMDPGFEKAFQSDKIKKTKAPTDDDDSTSTKIPDLPLGTITPLKDTTTRAQEVPKPVYYDRITIVEDMKTASKLAKDRAVRDLLAGCGIGTAATRPAMIDKLIERNYVVVMNKDDNDEYIKSTRKGRDFIKFVPTWLSSIELTAMWEKKLKEIIKEPSESVYRGMVTTFVDEQVAAVEEYIRELDAKHGSSLVFIDNSRAFLSDRKIARAKDVSARVDVPLSRKELASGELLSDFIERYAGTKDNPKVIPTLKMTEILLSMLSARKLTKSAVPAEAFLDFNSSLKAIEDIKQIPLPIQPPSERQVLIAEHILACKSLPLPDGYKDDVKVCIQYIKEAGVFPPTEKQITTAKEISAASSKPLPPNWDVDYFVCSDFLKQNYGLLPASEKQLRMAEDLAKQLNIPLPADHKFLASCSKFIGECIEKINKDKKKKGTGKAAAPAKTGATKTSATKTGATKTGAGGSESAPSEKMLSYAKTLAKINNVSLPKSASTTFKGCSEFIEKYKTKKAS